MPTTRNLEALPEKLYGRTDIDSVSCPTEDTREVRDSDGKRVQIPVMHKHVRTNAMNKPDGGKGPFVLECKSCIGHLVNGDPNILTRSMDPGVSFSTHWSPNATSVPKSGDEVLQEDEAQRQFLRDSVTDYQEFRDFQRQRRRKAVNFGQ